MSADAIARLRAELEVMGEHGMRYCEQVRTDDLRALLDERDSLAAQVVAGRQACDKLRDGSVGRDTAQRVAATEILSAMYAAKEAEAVLTKAGRR